MPEAEITRKTKETQITAKIKTNSENPMFIGTTGIGFFDHMLNSFCVHGGFELNLQMSGDLNVDCHHTVEDVGIILGRLFYELREKGKNINRFGSAYIPMDEALVFCAVDAGGRAYLVYDVPVKSDKIGEYDTQMTKEFFYAFAVNSAATIHIKSLYGENDHHKVEAVFKAFAKAMKEAYEPKTGPVLSTKGVL